jgi:hypothetical protein
MSKSWLICGFKVKVTLGFEETLKGQMLFVFSELKEESDGIYTCCGVLE